MSARPHAVGPALAGFAGLALLAVLVLDPSSVRTLLVSAFLLAGPGLALVPLLHVPDRVLGGVLVVATSLSLAMIVAGVQLLGGGWSPRGTLLVLCLVTLGGAAVQARGGARAAAAGETAAAEVADGVEPGADASLAESLLSGRRELDAAAAASGDELARTGERIETAADRVAVARTEARSALETALEALRSESLAAERLAAAELRALEEVLGVRGRAAEAEWPTLARAGELRRAGSLLEHASHELALPAGDDLQAAQSAVAAAAAERAERPLLGELSPEYVLVSPSEEAQRARDALEARLRPWARPGRRGPGSAGAQGAVPRADRRLRRRALAAAAGVAVAAWAATHSPAAAVAALVLLVLGWDTLAAAFRGGDPPGEPRARLVRRLAVGVPLALVFAAAVLYTLVDLYESRS